MAIHTIHATLKKEFKRPFAFSLNILICSLLLTYILTEHDTESNRVALDDSALTFTGNNVIILQQQRNTSGFCTKRSMGV